jgi:hypothetical protein
MSRSAEPESVGAESPPVCGLCGVSSAVVSSCAALSLRLLRGGIDVLAVQA